MVLGMLNQPIVEQRQGRRGQFGACLGERLFRELAYQLGPAVQMGKELIKFRLNALAHATEHQRHQSWQGQFALTREGAGVIGMGRMREKFVGAQACVKLAKKRGEGHVDQ